MMLITKQIWNRLVALGEQDVPNPVVPLKLFTPDSEWTWFVTAVSQIYLTDGSISQPEVDKVPVPGKNGVDDVVLFGWVCGMEQELGYFSLGEITGVRGPFGLKVERDQWFKEQRLDAVKATKGVR